MMKPNAFYESLRRGACHLWYWRIQPMPKRGMDLLSPGEMARYRRFLVPQAAQTFLGAHVLLRSVLSAYCDIGPAEWRFETNPWGRPFISNPEARSDLLFNLSDKLGFAVCLVGCRREIGVDVEDLAARRADSLRLAVRFFTSAETEMLRALPANQQQERFLQLWTLKEAYTKARGRGLSLGLNRFAFSVTGDQAEVRFEAGFGDDPSRWEFRLFRPDPRHVIATAVERPPGARVEISVADAENIVLQALGYQPVKTIDQSEGMDNSCDSRS